MKKLTKSKHGFSLVEVMVGLFLLSLISLSVFKFIDHLAKAVELQYDYVKATELADKNFKELKLGSYSALLHTLGLEAASTRSSDEVVLEITEDGYRVTASGTPNSTFGPTAGDALLVEVSVSWDHVGQPFTRSYETTMVNGGLAQ